MHEPLWNLLQQKYLLKFCNIILQMVLFIFCDFFCEQKKLQIEELRLPA